MLLGLFATDTADTLSRAQAAPAAELLPSFSESYHAAFAETRAYANSDALWRARHEVAQAALDRLEDATGEVYANPEAASRGPNRDALEKSIRARFDSLKAERPDLDLAYPTDDEIQAGAVAKAQKVKGERDALAAKPGDFASGAGFLLGDIAGAMTDPLNIASMFAGAPPAAGILKTAAIEAGIAATSQAVIEAGTAPFKKEVDPNYGLAEAAGNVTAAAAGGAIIGGGLKAAGRGLDWWRGRNRSELPREVQDALNVAERDQEVRAANPLGPGVAAEQAHAGALQKATQDMEAGRSVDVQAIVREARQLGEAYDEVRAAPLGAPDNPLVELRPSDIERVLVERGPVREKDGEIQVRWKGQRGYGLAKVIWRHGEEAAAEAPEFRVTRDDVIALPDVLRRFEADAGSGRGNREWRVEREGRTVVYALAPMPEGDAERLVTIYVQRPDRSGAEKPLSREKPAAAESPLKVGSPLQDTGREPYPSSLDGRAGPASQNVVPNSARVYTPSGRPVDVEYRAVEAESLIASHDAQGGVNPQFPAELQPRDRTRIASQAQIADMAANLQPERLGRSPDAATGAPIVGPDNVVESGNGRVGAIRRAYEQGGEAADRYRAWAVQQDPAAAQMRNPVLVAVRRTDVDRAAFAREANAATAARLSPTEQALADARHLDDAVMERLTSGDVGAASNRSFARGFLDRLPASERGALVDADGALNQEGIKRVQGALLGRAYGNAGIIGRIIEDADSDIRAIGGALLDVAGPWAKLRAAAVRGDLAPGMDATADLLAAVRMVAEARGQGRAVAELANQGGLFGDDLPGNARLFLGALFRDADLSKPAGRQRVADFLRGYLDEATKNTSGDRLFGEPLSAEQILRGERMTGEVAPDIGIPISPRPAEEVAAAPETQDALFQQVNRLLASREIDVPMEEIVDEAGKVVAQKRSAMDLMDEADRAINDAATVAACAFGVAAE
ncbi:hypothetical protein FBZ82_101190 [Azospirillum brasilense]|uniref:DdrB-like domain-containing protein n=1 Tax=Azospirillum brasilense TaxID=192 RepID=A0A560BNI3_AZOBR|nr:hypothetical protein [Azospirillum brasilense]TWA74175.1 hypothetical protein FBZ82_101190 [Azospirillum brasilense]